VTPTYFAVRRRRGRAWNAALTMRKQPGWDEHAAFMNALAAEGFIVLGGPLSDGIEVLHVVDAPDEEVIRKRFDADPWTATALLEIARIEPWTILLDRDTATPEQRALLTRTYTAFNARDIDAALATMHPSVQWENGMEGGIIQGRDAVRDYWLRQWRLVDPHVEPRRFAAAGQHVVVDVAQIVRDLTGRVVKNQHVRHAYVVEDGLIRRMEIRAA
jgi:uncharacterized protein YciI/ketosteroid isomerase-like protein